MKKIYTLILIVCTIFLVSCDFSDSYDYDDVTYPDATEETVTVSTIDLDDATYENYDEEVCVVLDSTSDSYYITEEGNYILRGTITETVIIDVGDDNDVRLILDDVTIETTLDSAILVLTADDVEISVPEGTVNYLADSANYSESYSDYGSVIYSEADLVINGTGSLEVDANYNNGIQTKDDLIIVDVELEVTSVDDGIVGRDSLSIQAATISVVSQGDSLKSTYTSDDDTETDKGYIQIVSGNITLDSGNDGLEATSNIIISGGTIVIDAESQGISSDASFYYYDGTITIDSKGDAIHVVSVISITGGELTITTDDDAIHSDEYLYISNGIINILDCFEGIEGKYIYISGGYIDILAEDDGINGSDPNVSTWDAAKPGEDADPSTSTALVEISGGVILIESEDDSIDSNGTLNISGGTIVVNGPTSGAQSAFDYDIEFNLTGGTLIAVAGYGQETKTPTDNSTQYSFLYVLDSTEYSGTQVTLLDENDDIIISFEAEKAFQAIIISTPELDDSTSYTLCLDGEVTGTLTNNYYLEGTLSDYQVVESFTLDDITSTFGDTSSSSFFPSRR